MACGRVTWNNLSMKNFNMSVRIKMRSRLARHTPEDCRSASKFLLHSLRNSQKGVIIVKFLLKWQNISKGKYCRRWRFLDFDLERRNDWCISWSIRWSTEQRKKKFTGSKPRAWVGFRAVIRAVSLNDEQIKVGTIKTQLDYAWTQCSMK